MCTLRLLVALCLAVLWLPVSVHCAVDASGILDRPADSCCNKEHDCSESPCSLVPQGEYNPFTPAAKAAPPTQLDWISLVCPRDLMLPPRETIAPVDGSERPPDWIVAWHFVRRAAGIPRAPAVGV